MSSVEYCLHQHNTAPLYAQLESLDPTRRFKVTVTPWKSKRSQAQNSRYWVIMTAFGEHLGYTKYEMHDICRYQFLSETVIINNKSILKLKSTPKTNTTAFAIYSAHCERWAAEMGFIGRPREA